MLQGPVGIEERRPGETCARPRGKAHELAGLSLWEFRQLLGARQIPVHFSAEDLEQDVETLRERDSRYKSA